MSPEQHQAVGVRFTETMRGFLSTEPMGDYTEAAEEGKRNGSPLEFTLTVIVEDVEFLERDPERRGTITGTVTASRLSAEPLTVEEGQFQLFVEDAEEVGTRKMIYRLPMRSSEGESYLLEGFKNVRDDPGIDIWRDTTTLFITVSRGDDPAGEVLGRGVLRILVPDFARQLTTMRAVGGAGVTEQLTALGKFGRFFCGSLFDVYGGVFARTSVLDPGAPPRQRRPLATGAPTLHTVRTDDGLSLSLTRYHGGAKGPVLLSHGLGVSSRIFTIDTIEQNLTEFLVAAGYDVWLLDHRASIELETARRQDSADEVATLDYPAAVAEVRRLTGADGIQCLAHCYGSTALFMALLAGLEGVRSVVCSQVACHLEPPLDNRIKTGLHLPSFLKRLGVDSLTAYVDADASWQDRLLDQALRLYPVAGDERCNSRVCHRVTFMYGHLYKHGQLNATTHDALHEMLGVAAMSAFEHLGVMMRARRIVNRHDEDVYLEQLDRLALPILFLHGEDNVVFLPESTERTYDLLRSNHGEELYSRRVVPGYGHIDCIFGKNAARDVYPQFLEHLEAT